MWIDHAADDLKKSHPTRKQIRPLPSLKIPCVSSPQSRGMSHLEVNQKHHPLFCRCGWETPFCRASPPAGAAAIMSSWERRRWGEAVDSTWPPRSPLDAAVPMAKGMPKPLVRHTGKAVAGCWAHHRLCQAFSPCSLSTSSPAPQL